MLWFTVFGVGQGGVSTVAPRVTARTGIGHFRRKTSGSVSSSNRTTLNVATLPASLAPPATASIDRAVNPRAMAASTASGFAARPARMRLITA